MVLIRCAECKTKVSDKATTCPKCGAPVEYSKKKQKNQISTGSGCLIILLVVVGIIAAFVASDKSGSSSPTSPSSRANPMPKPTVLNGIKPQIQSKKLTETPIAIETQIECDKFELVTKVESSSLDLSIDTDLPDNTVVMVSVSRSYLQKDNSAKYSVDYFSEKSSIGKWKSEHSISIASEDWITALRAKQEKMSRIGLGFDVASISDKITVRMVVPINQPDPLFGDRNQNLIGKAVKTKDIRIVEDNIEIDYPLNAPSVGKSPFHSLDPLELEIGQAYVVSRQTPLMPSHSPANPIAAIQQIKQISKGGGFKVLEVYTEKNNPWYKVTAFDQSAKQIGTGWINSTALLGQQLKSHR